MSTKTPRVTIGIPVYNAACTLPVTLRSVFCQTFSDWELVLIDDGSTDGSVELMRGIEDDRVRVFADGLNKTQGPRHNEISRLAKAPLVALLDADDVMHPDRLRRQVEYMEAHPQIDLVGTGVYSIDSRYQLQGKRGRRHLPSSELAVGLQGMFIQPTVTGRTSWFRGNPYDESEDARRCEDRELWFRTYDRGSFGLISEPLLFYMENAAQAMGKLRSSNRGMLRIMFTGHSDVRKRPLSVRLTVAAIICAKMAAYELCWLLGARGYLVDRRNQPLDSDETKAAHEALERVMAQPIPGLD